MHVRVARMRIWKLCISMSKIASSREEPNLFEFFRAPKVFETKSQSAPQSPTIGFRISSPLRDWIAMQRSEKEMDEKMNESCATFIHSFTALIYKKLGHFLSDLTFIFPSENYALKCFSCILLLHSLCLYQEPHQAFA